MRSWSFYIVAAAGLASIVATFAGAVTVVGLPLAAATVVAAIAMSRPRGWAWRFALLGSIAWFSEEVVWAVKRHQGVLEATFPTDVTYFAGVVLWCAALLLMRGRRLRTRLWLFMVPALAIVVWMLAVQSRTSVELQFPYIDALMLVVALPALEPALRGRASEGRVLIVLAFFIRAVGSSAFAWRDFRWSSRSWSRPRRVMRAKAGSSRGWMALGVPERRFARGSIHSRTSPTGSASRA